MQINLIDVKIRPDAVDILYDILSERSGDVKVNISHKPGGVTYESHRMFVENHPYEAWYLIEADGVIVGSVYLTKPPRPSVAGNEIGIFLRSEYRGKGIGPQVIQVLMAYHGPGRYLANISPQNDRSIAMFERMGFRHCQNTYEFFKT